jgi:hypothetical protein
MTEMRKIFFFAVVLILLSFSILAPGQPALFMRGTSGGGTEIIGYETEGGTAGTLTVNYIACSAMDAPSQNGTIDTIWIYNKNVDAGTDIKVGIYQDNGSGTPSAKAGSEVEFTNIGYYATPQWSEYTGFNISVSSGVNYWICVQPSLDVQYSIYYNSLAGTNRHWDQTQTYGSAWPSTFTSSTSSALKYSMKAQVTY